MEILDSLLAQLPATDIPVTQVQVGIFWTAVASKNCGLASTFINKENPHIHKHKVRQPGQLANKTARELADYAKSTSLLDASIGMAAVNSLLDIDTDQCRELNAGDYLCTRAEGKKCAIVGHFPFVDKIREVADDLWVIEKQPREGDNQESEMEQILPRCQVIGITGTSFINHTLEKILHLCPKHSFKVIIGPSTPLTPMLFDYGIDALFGSKVVDQDNVLRYIAQAATFREIHHQGVKLLSMTKAS